MLFLGVCLFLISGCAFLFKSSEWTGTANLHTVVEAVSTVLALVIGLMALVRFYSKEQSLILFIGVGFLGTAVLDGYHCLVTSEFFSARYPSALLSLAPWSWLAPRVFLSVCLFLSWVAWRRELHTGSSGLIKEEIVYLVGTGLTVLTFLFFAFVPLPAAYYLNFFLHRPGEAVPAFFFAVALYGYFQKGHWKHDDLEHSLLIFLIFSVGIQCLVMPYSETLFDGMFDGAHLLKLISYFIVLVGLLMSMYDIFRQADTELTQRQLAEQELRHAQHRLSAIFDNTFQLTLLISPQGEILRVNNTSLNLFRRSQDEVVGKQLHETEPWIYSWDTREDLEAWISQAMRNEIIHKEVHVAQEGTRGITLSYSLKPIHDDSGQVTYLVLEGRDLSELAEARLRLLRTNDELELQVSERTSALVEAVRLQREAELQARDLYQHSPDMMVSVDPQNGTVLECNQTLCDVLGRSREELLGEPVFDFYHPDSHDAARRAFEEFQTTGQVKNAQLQLLLRDGSPLHVMLNASSLRNEEGKIIRSRSVWRDISDMKAAQDALALSEERHRSLLSISTSIIWSCDQSGGFITPQISWEKYTGQSWEEHHGFGWAEMIHHEDREELLQLWETARKTNTLYEASGRLWSEEFQDYRYFVAQAVPLFDEQNSLREWIGMVTDIHDRVQARRQLELANDELERRVQERTAELVKANRDLDSFAYSASHDLKAPLRGVDNLSTWLLEDALEYLPEESQEHLRLIKDRVKRLESLLDGLLLYSRVGRSQIPPEELNTKTLVEEVIDLIAPPETFSFEIAPDLPTLTTVRVSLEQVLQNLIVNAVKYHDRPDGTIRIGARETDSGWEFFVSDDGPGIPPKFHERIFRIFQTLQSRDTIESSGIGLAICKKAVEDCGGKIFVESNGERGTTFRFTWPTEAT